MPTRSVVGLDVGYSTKRRSCGLATLADDFVCQKEKRYGDSVVRTGVYTLPELQAALTECSSTSLREAIFVVDAPLGRNGPPKENRLVDGLCSRESFYRRAASYQIRQAGEFVGAAEKLIDALRPVGDGCRPYVWMGGPVPVAGLVLAETNPTVALAVLLEHFPIESIASRNNPKPARGGDMRMTRAKSDWYWFSGGNKRIADLLKAPVDSEENHDRIAALVCLAIGAELARSPSHPPVLAVGDQSGVYALPQCYHRDWDTCLRPFLS